MKATKKIVGASCALVAALALSAGSTFAWFTSNSNVSVSQIQANVVTLGGDLQIGLVKYSIDGSTDTTLVGDPKTDDIASTTWGYSVDPELEGLYLDAVTSTDGTSFKSRGGSAFNVAANSTTETAGSYIQFTVALRSTTNMTVYLANNSAIASEDAENETTITAWKDITTTDYGENASEVNSGESIKAEAKNASRVSFTSIDALNITTNTAKTAIWAPNEEADFGGLATANGYSLGNLASDYEANAKGDEADTYTNVAATEYGAAGVSLITPYTVDDDDEAVLSENNVVVELTANNTTYVTIRFWLEGRDGDCFNSIFGQSITIDLAFYGEDKVADSGAEEAP